MTADEYRALRERLGSQSRVARALGVDKMTVSRRERGTRPVVREAALALRYVADHPDMVPDG